jgi:hypothetical protein
MLQGIKPMCVRRPYRREQHQNGDADEYSKTQPRRENVPNAHSSLSPSVLPKTLEAIRRQLGVAHGVLGTGSLFVAQKSQVEILIVIVIESWRCHYKRASQHPSVYVIEENRLC